MSSVLNMLNFRGLLDIRLKMSKNQLKRETGSQQRVYGWIRRFENHQERDDN